MGTGNYSKDPFNLNSTGIFDEAKRYLGTLLQQDNKPLIDADWNDQIMIILKQLARSIQQASPYQCVKDSFKILESTSPANNFIISTKFDIVGGSDPTNGPEEFARAWVGGQQAILQSNSTEIEFNTTTIAEIKEIAQRIDLSAVAGTSITSITDKNIKYNVDELAGMNLVLHQVDSTGVIVSITTSAISANSADTITMASTVIDANAVYGYYITAPTTPTADRIDEVYLDVYLRDSGSDLDSDLAPIPNLETMRRIELAQVIRYRSSVEEPVGTLKYITDPSDAITGELIDYVDTNGNQHWVVRLARIARTNGATPILTSGITDTRDVWYGSSKEIVDARTFDSGSGDVTYSSLKIALQAIIDSLGTLSRAVPTEFTPPLGDKAGIVNLTIAGEAFVGNLGDNANNLAQLYDNVFEDYFTTTLASIVSTKKEGDTGFEIIIGDDLRIITTDNSGEETDVTVKYLGAGDTTVANIVSEFNTLLSASTSPARFIAVGKRIAVYNPDAGKNTSVRIHLTDSDIDTRLGLFSSNDPADKTVYGLIPLVTDITSDSDGLVSIVGNEFTSTDPIYLILDRLIDGALTVGIKIGVKEALKNLTGDITQLLSILSPRYNVKPFLSGHYPDGEHKELITKYITDGLRLFNETGSDTWRLKKGINPGGGDPDTSNDVFLLYGMDIQHDAQKYKKGVSDLTCFIQFVDPGTSGTTGLKIGIEKGAITAGTTFTNFDDFGIIEFMSDASIKFGLVSTEMPSWGGVTDVEAGGSVESDEITVNGAAIGDIVQVSPTTDLGGLKALGYVSATDTVKIILEHPETVIRVDVTQPFILLSNLSSGATGTVSVTVSGLEFNDFVELGFSDRQVYADSALDVSVAFISWYMNGNNSLGLAITNASGAGYIPSGNIETDVKVKVIKNKSAITIPASWNIKVIKF